MRVLVIDDDQQVSRLLSIAFERDGHETAVARSACDGIDLFSSWLPDLVLLDLGLPDLHGREVLRHIRAMSDVPVIVVSGAGEVVDRVVGLELGSDDYVVKPFSISEVVARGHAVLRRTRPTAKPDIRHLQHEDLVIEVDEHRVLRAGTPLDLTKKEFQLLRMLMEHAGSLVSRSDIAHALWGVPVIQAARSMDVCVSALRRKLGDDPKDPRYIETVRGVGLRLRQPERPARLRVV